MPTFCKRHYEAIATAMQAIHPGFDPETIDHEARAEMWGDVVGELCQTFTLDNQLFKRDRFEVACLPGNNVRART